MLKFLTGLFSGVAIVAISIYIVVPQQTLYNTKLVLEHGTWAENSGRDLSGYNHTFGHGVVEEAGGYLPTQINALTLASQTPVYTFDRAEIERVCAQPSWFKEDVHIGGMTITIFLNKEARNRLGSFLLSRPDENISLMYGGDQLNVFSISTEKVNTYIKNANDPLFTADIYDPKQRGDFNIDVTKNSLTAGFLTGFLIAGDKGFQHCGEGETLNGIIGYEEAKNAYEAMKKQTFTQTRIR